MSLHTITKNNINSFCFDTVPVDSFWNMSDEQEKHIHRIHSYPAKFPAFITSKALKKAQLSGKSPRVIADIFCGCGTTAIEAKRNSIDFWGCDINPVATLIASVKSRKHEEDKLKIYYDSILKLFESTEIRDCYEEKNERLQYWYHRKQLNQLAHLKHSIDKVTKSDKLYNEFFWVAFSNILKPVSRWLTKSIKPQIDPDKKVADVLSAFKKQFKIMLRANNEISDYSSSSSRIVTGSVLDKVHEAPTVDMIVTSPPYVTSYEYADLHQLSSLWLDYVQDFRDLREGTIGSLHHNYDFNKEFKRLNSEGYKIVSSLMDIKHPRSRSVAKYFLDMQKIAKASYGILNEDGSAVFVIGNTEFKGVRINNAKHLALSLIEEGFKEVSVSKRKISNKILTPYRDGNGKFTTNSSGRKVYNEEFILVASKET